MDSSIRIDITSKIICNMIDELKENQIEKLKNVMTLVLNDYDITKREKSLAVYSGNEIEYMVKKFLIEKKVQGCTDRTLEYYGSTIPKVMYSINKPLRDVTADDILIYIANRDIKDKISKTTQDNELRCVRTFFAFLIAEEYIARNPCLRIKKIRAAKVKRKAFSDIEIEKIRNACKNKKEKALIESLLSTGCRATELGSIKYTDIKEDKIDIIGKGRKTRTVYFNAKAQIAIESYMSERNDNNPYLFPKMKSLAETKEIRLKKHMNYDYRKPVFVTEDEGATADYIGSMVRNIGKRAGVKNTHPHRFRRTCATMALRRGMPLMQVSKMLGHEDVGTTQIYLDINEDELEQAHKKYVV